MSYNKPLASVVDYGVVKVGAGINVVDGVISTSTGSASNYGFISSSTTQTNPVADAINTVTFDTIGPANSVAIGPGNDSIVVANAGTYTKLFTLTTSKTSGGTTALSIWLRRNGVDLVGSAQDLQLTNTLSTIFVTGNYTLDLAAGDNIQMCWSSADITIALAALPPLITPIRPSGYAAKITLTRIS